MSLQDIGHTALRTITQTQGLVPQEFSAESLLPMMDASPNVWQLLTQLWHQSDPDNSTSALLGRWLRFPLHCAPLQMARTSLTLVPRKRTEGGDTY